MKKTDKEVWLGGQNISSEAMEKRKKINKKILTFGCLPIALLFGFIFLTIVFPSTPAEDPPTNQEEKKDLTQEVENLEPGKFDYHLPKSDYHFEVSFLGIETETVANAFTSKKDEYSVPQDVDGYKLIIKFQMRNPYDKEMMASVPKYHYITSANKEYFSGSTTYSRSCGCEIDNSARVTDNKGKGIIFQVKGKCGYSGDYCIRFGPNETKEFHVSFRDPIIETVRQIVYVSFHRSWKGKTGNSRDLGWLIDIDQNKVIENARL